MRWLPGMFKTFFCCSLIILFVFMGFTPLRGQQIVGTPVTFSVSLDFPIQGYVPYTATYFDPNIAPMNSVFDHSINSKPDGSPSFYANDNGVIQTYTGEKGEKQYCTPSELVGVCSGTQSPSYPNKDHQAFEVNGLYLGRPSGTVYLQYEGHAGYDYNLTGQIIAPADGLLVIPKVDPINGNFGTVSPWCGFHTFYIDHGNGYTTWYLHANDLNPLLGGPGPYAYCDHPIPEGGIKLGRVTRGQYIADVGGWGGGQPGTFGVHLHFELRKNGIPIDPYGWRNEETDPVQQWETSINLWNHQAFKADPSVRWHPDGTLIRAKGGSDVFLIDNGSKKKISSQDIFNGYGFLWHKVIEVEQEELACYQEYQNDPLDIPPRLARQVSTDKVYIIFDNEYKKAIATPEVFEGLLGKENWTTIEDIPESELNSYQNHPSAPELFSPFPDGTLIKAYGSSTIYVISNGKRQAIASPSVFNNLGYNWDEVVRIPAPTLNNIPEITPIIDENRIISCGHAPPTPSDFYYLSGTLTDANGTPAMGYVYAYETTGANPGNNVWTSNGNYRMALFPGTYNVYASVYKSYPNGTLYIYTYNQIQTVTLNADVTLNIRLPLYQYYHVTGRVTDTRGNGLANVQVQLWNTTGTCGSYAWTSGNGSYDALVIEGIYTLEVVPPSGSRFTKERISNLQVYGNVVRDISLSEQFILSGTVTDSNGNPTQASVYAYEINWANPGNSGWSATNGTYQLALLPGTYVVGGSAYIPYSQGYTWITLPQQTITINSDSVLNIQYPAYQFYHLRGKVTDVNNISQPNVRLSLWNNVGTCSGYAWTSGDGSYDLLLIPGSYEMAVYPPPETYPPFYAKKVDIIGDTIRNIRLSRDYFIYDQALSYLSPSLEVGLDIFDIIQQGGSIIYDIVIKSAKTLLQIILNWPGSQMGVTVYRPDGSIYGEYQSTTPPIIIDIPNPEIGTWTCEVKAIEVPYDNYPFALVAGVTPNQSPTAEAGGPYSGTIGYPITFDASGSNDSDGSIASYKWDWNNDGIYDEMTTSPTIIHTWDATYSGIVGLKVTDNEGLTAYDTASVEAKEKTIRISGGAYFYPEAPTYRASFSMDVTGPSSPSGWLKYYYTRTRMNFVSTGITSASFSGNTATLSGAGTVNGVSSYTFTATVTTGTPDSFSIVIRKSDGSTYYSAGPKNISGGDLVIQ